MPREGLWVQPFVATTEFISLKCVSFVYLMQIVRLCAIVLQNMVKQKALRVLKQKKV